MGAIASPGNLGISELLQTLSDSGNKILITPAMVSALESAPPQDVADISAAAVQSQGMTEFLGLADGTSGSTSPTGGYTADMSNILASLADSVSNSTAPITTATAAAALPAQPTALQLAQYQTDMQGSESSALIGPAPAISAVG